MSKTSAPTASRSSVSNALRVLLMLRDHPELRVTDVAASLDVAPSTAHRLLHELREQGFLRQVDGSRRYTAGLSLLRLAAELDPGPRLEDVARPHLLALSQEVGETVNLQTLTGGEVVFLETVEAARSLRVVRPAGSRIPAYASAGGKVLLASRPTDDVPAIFASGLPSRTPWTISDVDRLQADLEQVRRQGYATNLEENTAGVNAIAVPVVDRREGVLAALSVAAPTIRMTDERLIGLLPRMRLAAHAIARGYAGGGQ
jgi:DNA-binding IclR family transcriptional regulator